MKRRATKRPWRRSELSLETLVLGIDPGSHATGYGLVRREGNRYTSAARGVIRAPEKAPLVERLALIHAGVVRILAETGATCVAVETPFFARSAHSTLVLGHVRGVILLAIHQSGAFLHEYAPRQVKSAVVGNGAASKEQVQFMVTRLLGLGETPATDAADALAVALCHHHRANAPGAALRAAPPGRTRSTARGPA